MKRQRQQRRRHAAPRRLGGEPLEPRQLLSAAPVITEFMASNDGALRDGDGATSDWIELFNPGNTPIDLAGYRLTDQRDNPSRWVFPSFALEPGEHRVVFASGQDRDDYVDAHGNLHTSFSLRARGEYLALIAPDGTILSQFGDDQTDYPAQRANVSYGMAQRVTLLDGASDAQYWVPLDGSLGADWTRPDFNALGRGFLTGKAALGFESRPEDRVNFADEIQTTLPPRTHAVYVRLEFTLDDAAAVTDLVLRAKYDNALVVYLNGAKVAETNAPADPRWFTPAPDGSRPDSEALEYADLDLTAHRSELEDGTNVLAIHLMGNLQDDSDMLLVPQLVAGVSDMMAAVGRTAKQGYMPTPTPGAPNVSNREVYSGLVADTRFSVDRGFYDKPVQVEITTDTAGAEIRYTTDGKVPTASTGKIYTGPITVAATTTLRATAFAAEFLPTNVDTHTYVFPEDVIRQPARIPGIPTSIDLGMDPDVVDDPRYADEIIDALQSIPTMSVSLAPEDFFGSSRGIYANPQQRGDAWERAASIELVLADGTRGFQEDGGIRIFGNGSRGQLKKTFRLVFRGVYGARKLEYPLFPDSTVQKYDNLILRPQNAHSWRSAREIDRVQADYIEDAFARDAAAAMGKFDGHARFVHLYINGLYWGLYTIVERPDAGFAEEYLGGRDEDYDAINRRPVEYGGNGTEAIDGDLEAWRQMITIARTDLSDPANYAAIQQYVDPVNLVQQFLIHQYMAHNDGPERYLHNNMRLIRRREPGSTFLAFAWDMERSFVDVNQRINITVDVPDTLSEVYTAMQGNPEFRMLYADLAHKYLFYDGALTAEAATARYLERTAQIESAIVAESARWGDNQPNPVTPGRPFTRDIEWQAEVDRMVNEYFPRRPSVLIEQLRGVGLYPDIDAPVFSQHGGPVPQGFSLTMGQPSDDEVVLYTLDGTDPRQVGGQIASEALVYDGTPVILDADTTVKARVRHGDTWSALNAASFFVMGPASPFHLRVTEINYHPHEANPVPGLEEAPVTQEQFQFIEIMNTGGQPVPLDGVQLTQAVEYTFPAAMTLASHERVVVVKNLSAFRSRYGAGPKVIGEFEKGELSNAGELVQLRDRRGRLIQSFRYDDERGWPARADGLGSSLEIIDPMSDADQPSHWRSSLEFGGSPAAVGADTLPTVAISEVLAHSPSPLVDAVELHNFGDRAIEISNWYISNRDEDYFRFRVPAGTVLPGEGYTFFGETELGFGLSGAQGGQVWVIAADAQGRPTRFVDHARFGPSAEGVSLGPWPGVPGELLPLAARTLGRENSGLLTGAVTISEVHYAPVDPDGDRGRFHADDFEFVELHNRTDATVDLSDWRLAGGIEFVMPAGTEIGPQNTLVVVPFDPGERNLSAIFRITLGAEEGVPLVGPFVGHLADAGASLRLERLVSANTDDPDFAPYLSVDELTYATTSPWPTDVVGTGKSLQRTSPTQFGRFPGSWHAGTAGPGSAPAPARRPGDANEDGRFDALDLVMALQGGKYQSGQAATWSEGDWNGDGRFDQGDIVAALQAGKTVNDTSP